MVKTSGKLMVLTMLLVCLMVALGCGKRARVPIGSEGANERTAGFRTAGGGIEDKAYPAGQRYKIGGFTSKSRMLLVRNTPFTITRDNLKVRMVNWSNLDMTFDVTATVSIVPGTGYRILKDIGPNWENTVVAQPLVTVSQDILGQQNRESLRDRETICSQIKAALEERIRQRGQTAAECVSVLDVTLNNMDYPGEILTAKAKTATEKYRKRIVEIEQQITDYEGQKGVIEAETINMSYSIEAGATNPNFLAWQNFQVMEKAMISDNEITLIFLLDERGIPTYMQAVTGRR